MLEEYGITVDRLGNVTGIDHTIEDDNGEPCSFHNPSVHPLALAPIQYVASVGLGRVCHHEVVHPDADALIKQRAEYPMYAKSVERIHDAKCCGCCRGAEPVKPREDPGSHRAATGLILLPTAEETESTDAGSRADHADSSDEPAVGTPADADTDHETEALVGTADAPFPTGQPARAVGQLEYPAPGGATSAT